jgi:hypothetical protein
MIRHGCTQTSKAIARLALLLTLAAGIGIVEQTMCSSASAPAERGE